MSNYVPPVRLLGKLTAPGCVDDIATRPNSTNAVVGRVSVSQVVGGAATPRARFKSHALPFNTASVPKSFTCCASAGSA